MQLNYQKEYLSLLKTKNLKRKANITFMVLSIFILLITPLIPHHHHDSAEYIVMDCCHHETEGADNTHQSHSDENPLCVKNTSFLEAKHYVSPENETDWSNILRDILLYQKIIESVYSITKNYIYQEYIITYRPIQIGCHNSLRAPPLV